MAKIIRLTFLVHPVMTSLFSHHIHWRRVHGLPEDVVNASRIGGCAHGRPLCSVNPLHHLAYLTAGVEWRVASIMTLHQQTVINWACVKTATRISNFDLPESQKCCKIVAFEAREATSVWLHPHAMLTPRQCQRESCHYNYVMTCYCGCFSNGCQKSKGDKIWVLEVLHLKIWAEIIFAPL